MSAIYYLEHYLESLEAIPLEFQRCVSGIRDADAMSQDVMAHVSKLTTSEGFDCFIAKLPPDAQLEALQKLKDALCITLDESEVKLEQAKKTLEIAKTRFDDLNADVVKYEREDEAARLAVAEAQRERERRDQVVRDVQFARDLQLQQVVPPWLVANKKRKADAMMNKGVGGVGNNKGKKVSNNNYKSCGNGVGGECASTEGSSHPTMLPIYLGKGPCPPLCGPVPAPVDYIIPRGDLVAALTSKPTDTVQEWILATIVRQLPNDMYEVEDVEDEDAAAASNGTQSKRKRLTVSSAGLVPLPKTLPDPARKLEFAVGRCVLALYPGTTCFYPATVATPPSKRGQENDYLVQFEDDDDEFGTVVSRVCPQLYCLDMPLKSERNK